MIIKYFAWIKNITDVEEEMINDKSIKDVDTLKIFLTKKYPDLKKHLFEENTIRIAINLKYNNKNSILKNSDEVALFPPVSGG